MKVIILQDLPRTIDGQRIGPFRKGSEHDLEQSLALKFIGSSMAAAYVEPTPEPIPELEAAAEVATVELSQVEAESEEGPSPGEGSEAEADQPEDKPSGRRRRGAAE